MNVPQITSHVYFQVNPIRITSKCSDGFSCYNLTNSPSSPRARSLIMPCIHGLEQKQKSIIILVPAQTTAAAWQLHLSSADGLCRWPHIYAMCNAEKYEPSHRALIFTACAQSSQKMPLDNRMWRRELKNGPSKLSQSSTVIKY